MKPNGQPNLLGMFWQRCNGHGAFFGLLSGTVAAAVHHGLSLPAHALPGMKGGWIAVWHLYPSEMAQNFWTAIFAWSTSLVLTIVVSLFTAPPDRRSLVGLTWGATKRQPTPSGLPWYDRPVLLGVLALGAVLLLNVAFF